ncbi:CapA family protein [Bacillus sp. T33-2]|uniref:CapA family protein n=1 Tax=Bacillus sp. T33-2 TaxID=2054168 RepID=UPI000C775C74|nr:CapA family protein [Bacillus sp. T33-2]PLR95259.1 capsular biosynthesis protein [Bacillus sp. T33-2]
MNTNKTIILTVISFVLILSAAALVYSMYRESAVQVDAKARNPVFHQGRSLSVSGKHAEEKVAIAAIGDILIHDTVYMDAQTNNGYDFKPMLAHVKEELLKPDLLLANQETVLGGVELGLSGYPTFNSPREVGDALIDAGVDIVSTANNHTLDKSERGIQSAIRYLDSTGLPYVGAFKNEDDRKTLRILNKNGVRIAFLSYTYGTNGIPVPEGKDFLVNLIDKGIMQEEITRARQEADVIVMSIHWGNEYQRQPNDYQRELAHFLVDQGVDVIFGHHPHVLQPIEWMETVDGRQALVVFSLGNFLSGQVRDYKDIGGMASVEITKHIGPNGNRITLSNPQFMPTYVASHRQRNYQVVPLQDAGMFGMPNAEAKYGEIMLHMTSQLNR